MLLEINCSVEHYMEFLNKAEAQGVKPDFDMHGADQNSSFGLTGSIEEVSEGETTEYDTYIDEDGNENYVETHTTNKFVDLDAQEDEDV